MNLSQLRGFFVFMTETFLGNKVTVDTQDRRLSRKVTGRLKAGFDRSPLIVVGGADSGRTVTSRLLLPSVDTIVAPRTGNPMVDAQFNADLPGVSDVLLGNTVDLNYVRGVGGADIKNEPGIAADIARGDSGTVFRIVYGATTEMPLRALSYPLPALQMMDALSARGLQTPDLQIVFANHFSTEVNNIQLETAQEQTDNFTATFDAYVATFFPHLSTNISFLEDNPLDSIPDAVDHLANAQQTLLGTSFTSTEKVSLKGERSEYRGDSLLYGAAHLLYHDLAIPGLLKYTDGEPLEGLPHTIINIGGVQEEAFYSLRSDLRNALDDSHNVRTLQLFTRHTVPPYYMALNTTRTEISDIRLHDGIQGHVPTTDIAPAALYDLKYLDAVSQSMGGSFSQFITMIREKGGAL